MHIISQIKRICTVTFPVFKIFTAELFVSAIALISRGRPMRYGRRRSKIPIAVFFSVTAVGRNASCRKFILMQKIIAFEKIIRNTPMRHPSCQYISPHKKCSIINMYISKFYFCLKVRINTDFFYYTFLRKAHLTYFLIPYRSNHFINTFIIFSDI